MGAASAQYLRERALVVIFIERAERNIGGGSGPADARPAMDKHRILLVPVPHKRNERGDMVFARCGEVVRRCRNVIDRESQMLRGCDAAGRTDHAVGVKQAYEMRRLERPDRVFNTAQGANVNHHQSIARICEKRV